MTIDWIDYIVDEVNKYHKGRKVVLWGKYEVSDLIKKKLKEKYKIDTAFFVDSDLHKINNREVFSTNYIYGKSSEYYIVIPLAFYQSLKNELTTGGYKPVIDYCYFNDCIICNTYDYYEDEHGNTITGNYRGLKFAFSGFNSKIKIGVGNEFLNVSIYVHSNTQIEIDDNAQLHNTVINAGNHSQVVIDKNVNLANSNINIMDHSKIQASQRSNLIGFSIKAKEYAYITIGENTAISGVWCMDEMSKAEVGDNSIFGDGIVEVAKNALIKIGRKFSTNPNYRIKAGEDSTISIGEDCMFSYDIRMRSNDGHSIFDIATAKNVNSTIDINKARTIIIGNHVWIGMGAVILYNTKIHDGSMIGAMSLVKGEIPNNCIAAGIPAKVTRRNIAWSRKNGAENIDACGREYINLTNEDV